MTSATHGATDSCPPVCSILQSGPRMTATVAEKQPAALRGETEQGVAQRLILGGARKAVALLIAVIGDLSQQLDGLLRELASTAITMIGKDSSSSSH
jgi:hypothetical protein